jgi:hypothetical protein
VKHVQEENCAKKDTLFFYVILLGEMDKLVVMGKAAKP